MKLSNLSINGIWKLLHTKSSPFNRGGDAVRLEEIGGATAQDVIDWHNGKVHF